MVLSIFQKATWFIVTIDWFYKKFCFYTFWAVMARHFNIWFTNIKNCTKILEEAKVVEWLETRTLKKSFSKKKQCLWNSAIKMGAISNEYQKEYMTNSIKRSLFNFLDDFILHFQITMVLIFFIFLLALICCIFSI